MPPLHRAKVDGPKIKGRLAPALLRHIKALDFESAVAYAAGYSLEGRCAAEARRMARIVDSLEAGGMSSSEPMEIAAFPL
jgi:hypothetical protein